MRVCKTNNLQFSNKQLVHFELNDSAARRVCIAGSFNDWHPDLGEMVSLGPGKWIKDLELAPGTYEYRFVVDGKWITDPQCPRTVPNAFGETNSLLAVSRQKAIRQSTTTKSSPRVLAQ